MSLGRTLRSVFRPAKHDFAPILSQQADFLCGTTTLLLEMFGVQDPDRRAGIEKQIKAFEVQGDALLTEFHEQLSAHWILKINKLDLQSVAMAMDDCLDVIKDTSKALLLYNPAKIDDQLTELAQISLSQSNAIREIIPYLPDIKKNVAAISLVCERVTELEHIADDAFEDYIGFIFRSMDDVKELVKYKNLAEMLENVTDAHKRISDNVRKLLLNYLTK